MRAIRGVEARDRNVKVLLEDVDDVGAGVEGLVLGPVEVGGVLELDGGNLAGGDARRGLGEVEARVAGVDFFEGNWVGHEGEVLLGFWVFWHTELGWL